MRRAMSTVTGSISAATPISFINPDSTPTSTGSATATDNCDAGPAIGSSDSAAAGACAQESVVTRTWTATDTCGNSVSGDQTITIVDTSEPAATVPTYVIIEYDAHSSPAGTGSADAALSVDSVPPG